MASHQCGSFMHLQIATLVKSFFHIWNRQMVSLLCESFHDAKSNTALLPKKQ